MLKHSSSKKGFTLIEALIVVSIITILAVIGVASLSNSRNKNKLSDEQANVVYAFQKARDSAVSGVGNTNYGIHVEADKLTVFQGTAWSGSTVEQQINLPSSITTDQTGTDFIFSRISGASSKSGVIILKQSGTGSTAKVTISADGQVQPY